MLKNHAILFILLSVCFLLSGCDQTNTPQTTTQNATDSSARAAVTATNTAQNPANVESTDTFVPLTERLTKASLKYIFKDKEVYDRCTAMQMTDKSGKNIELPKAIIAELECVGSAFEFIADRYIVYTEKNDVKIYDLNTKRISLLFTNFEGVQCNLTDVSDDHSRLLFVNVFYDDAQRKKSNYTQRTRIMVVDFDKETLKVNATKKYDRLVSYFEVEGDMVNKKDCQFVNNNTISYREYERNADGMPTENGKMSQLSL